MKFFFFIICILVFLFKTQTVFSSNLIYGVNNIEVSGKINNDLDKKKLIQSAFQKAFIIFVNKILLKEDAISLYKTKINTIEDLVFAYQIIKEEKKDKKKNILTVNVKFDQKKISSFLGKNSFSYVDVANISLTLLPVLVKKKEVFGLKIITEKVFDESPCHLRSESVRFLMTVFVLRSQTIVCR